MIRRTLLVLLMLVATYSHGIIIRSVQLRHVNRTIILLHDLHYAKPDIIAQQLAMIKEHVQQNPSTMLLVEAPPENDIHCIEQINTFLASPHAQTTSNLFLTTQKALGTLGTEPLLSQFGHLHFDCNIHRCDHRALLFAISDARAINRSLPTIDIPFNIGQLVAAIKQLEHELIEVQPVIANMPTSLIPRDYASCLATLRNYREQLNHLVPDENIFSSSENVLHRFFSWIINSSTICNLLLEATFIQAVQTCESTSIIIVTGAYHAERLQMYFEQKDFFVDHDSGITCNGKVVYESYGRILNTITRYSTMNVPQTLRTIIATIKPLYV